MSWWEPFADAWAALTPIGALLGGAAIAWAALRQAGIAARRHNAQTEADRQRRITESFSKAVEQLGSEKIEARLGGIYTLERISHESAAEYWTVMETLTAFVRERARWKEPDAIASETMARFYEDKGPASTQSNHEPATDIAAVLSVVVRRGDKNRDREKTENWRFNLRRSDLRRAFLRGARLERVDLGRAHLEEANLVRAHLEGADLREAHLEKANLREAHLEEADLWGAHLARADLREAHLEKANLRDAHLEKANPREAHLEEANLRRAHLEGADLWGAHLEGADLQRAHLEGADLRQAHLEGADLRGAHGDAKTILSQGVTRPPDWPPAHTGGGQ